MDLMNLELGRWVYLIIYAFLPATILLYMIRTYGLSGEENPAEKAQKHIEQAGYWAEIALKTALTGNGSKSLASLVYTTEHNLEEAAKIIETAELSAEQRQALRAAYNVVAAKLTQIAKPGAESRNHSAPFLPQAR